MPEECLPILLKEYEIRQGSEYTALKQFILQNAQDTAVMPELAAIDSLVQKMALLACGYSDEQRQLDMYR